MQTDAVCAMMDENLLSVERCLHGSYSYGRKIEKMGLKKCANLEAGFFYFGTRIDADDLNY
jgi:hypothetical protein